MNPDFLSLMSQAARLTQGGDLQAATAAIQAALSGSAVPAATDHADVMDVIDVEVREIHREAQQTTTSADPEPAAPAPAARPVNPGPAGQFISGTHTEAADTREYKLYIPAVATEEALPLVVMLHGCTQNPDDFAAGTGMNEAARQRGFYVLYPAQTQHANSSRCWNWFKHNHQKRGRGEPAILAGMTRDVMSRYNIDPQRVYVAGLSAGGAMAAILGDAYPDLFAAVGVHSGLPTGSASNVQGALSVMQTGAAASPRTEVSPPTIVFHGDQDATVHPANGEQVVAASAGVSKPEMKRARSGNGRDYTRRIYKEAGGRVVAEHWAVHGAGHAWSGGSARGSYTDAAGPDASEEMLRFFFANTLRRTH
ncbi:PHB depolymerase family esterase [Polaromonas sp.]|uniref:extracellular catalytic domain type 1 short-chain-length polyhydroxyalkanoate depolymerase n=1 Tax=Polaromonas sp. TaxID=1869339 RepID=UPI00182A2728|nr:PHB depolymerase family esterase [Polaromonas sp.]NMM07671.1 PHB depolymerase family esterase [Polaromonas sp.]